MAGDRTGWGLMPLPPKPFQDSVNQKFEHTEYSQFWIQCTLLQRYLLIYQHWNLQSGGSSVKLHPPRDQQSTPERAQGLCPTLSWQGWAAHTTPHAEFLFHPCELPSPVFPWRLQQCPQPLLRSSSAARVKAAVWNHRTEHLISLQTLSAGTTRVAVRACLWLQCTSHTAAAVKAATCHQLPQGCPKAQASATTRELIQHSRSQALAGLEAHVGTNGTMGR